MTNHESRPALLEAAMEYRAAGLCALPAIRAEKRPAVGSWKPYQTRLPTEAELSAWFANGPDAICLLCGQASGNLETIDFDAGGELFSAWWDRIPADLRDRLVVETTQSGGRHVVYRCQAEVCGNLKLAQRKQGDTIVTLIETRGEGGLFLCAPTAGYDVVQGDLRDPPIVTETERDALLEAAWALNEYVPEPVDYGPATPWPSDRRPGDDYNARGDIRSLLAKHDWTLAKAGENEYWRRPGKPTGWSATLKDGTLYVFSSNAAPFEPDRPYSPNEVALLRKLGLTAAPSPAPTPEDDETDQEEEEEHAASDAEK